MWRKGSLVQLFLGLTLRQVCQRLRYQVDHASESSHPHNKLTQLAIFVSSNQIRTQFASSTNPGFLFNVDCDRISYVLQENEKFSRKYNQGKPVEFEREHLVDMATNDLGRILKFQKWILKDFRLSFEKDMNQVFLSFPDAFNDILKSRNQTIKTETFDVCGYQSKHFLCMLPFLDSECLKCIDFRPPDETPIEFNWGEIVRNYPWITAKEAICSIPCTVPLEIITQFSKLNLKNSQSYTAQEMDYLKTATRAQLFCDARERDRAQHSGSAVAKKDDFGAGDPGLTLRQVCQRLRYQVDNALQSLPDSKLTRLRIFVESNQIRLLFISSTDFSNFDQKWDQISYVLQENGRFLRQYNQGEPVEFRSEHLVDMATNDLERILKFQKSTLTNIQLSFANDMNQVLQFFPEAFTDILKSGNHIIKTEKLDVSGYQSNHFLFMLHFLDSGSLKRIDLCCPDKNHIDFDLGEIVRSYPWITAKEVYFCITCTVPLEVIAQFLNLRLYNDHIYTAQEMDCLKTAFSKSSTFVLFLAHHTSNVPKIEEQKALWGRALENGWNEVFWYFRMANSDDILEVLYDRNYKILISRTNLDRVPRGAVIRDNMIHFLIK